MTPEQFAADQLNQASRIAQAATDTAIGLMFDVTMVLSHKINEAAVRAKSLEELRLELMELKLLNSLLPPDKPQGATP